MGTEKRMHCLLFSMLFLKILSVVFGAVLCDVVKERLTCKIFAFKKNPGTFTMFTVI